MAPWVLPAAMIASSVIGAGASAYSANKAAKAASNRWGSGIDSQVAMFNAAREDQRPFYIKGLESLNNLSGAYYPSESTPQYYEFGRGIDPSGGASKYLAELEQLSNNFQFDPENPNYKLQLEESNKQINQALAARGMYNSRPGINALADNQRQLMATEYDRQRQETTQRYQEQYSKLFDLFNMQSNLGQLDYNKELDLVKAGQNAAASMGNAALATGQGLASSYGDMASIQMAQGNNMSQLYSGLGAMPLNYMLLQNMFGGGGTPATGNSTMYNPTYMNNYGY